MLEKCLKLITAQQPETKNHIYWVGEQLKDIVRATPRAAQLVAKDIEQDGMKLPDLEKKISAYAKGNGGCTPPQVSDHIMREFYGLPTSENRSAKRSLTDFMG